MRRISRLDRSIGLLQPRLSNSLPSTCSSTVCHHQAPFSTSLLRRDEGKPDFTERLRRKIWGTDNPPGLKDPYGGESFLERRRNAKQRAAPNSSGREDTSSDIDGGGNDGTDTSKTPAAGRRSTPRPRATKSSPSDHTVKAPSTGRVQIGQNQKHTEEPPQKLSKNERRWQKWQNIEQQMHSAINVPADLPDDYIQAKTSEGLETLGNTPPELEARWSEFQPCAAFTPKERETDNQIITAALHRALVEVFSIKQMGVADLASVSKASTRPERLTRHVQILPSPDGATLNFSNNVSLEKIIRQVAPVQEGSVASNPPNVDDSIPEEVTAETSKSEEDISRKLSTIDSSQESSPRETYGDVVASLDPRWLQVSVADPNIKFAVIKRTMQLTGLRLSDSVIQSANTAQALLGRLVTRPKPKKLVEALSGQEKLLTLPNVSIYPKRLVPKDKEISVGRWKVIEEELAKRGLPLFGRE